MRYAPSYCRDVGTMLEQGVPLSVSCTRCSYHGPIDLAEVEAREGPRYTYVGRRAPCPVPGCAGPLGYLVIGFGQFTVPLSALALSPSDAAARRKAMGEGLSLIPCAWEALPEAELASLKAEAGAALTFLGRWIAEIPARDRDEWWSQIRTWAEDKAVRDVRKTVAARMKRG